LRWQAANLGCHCFDRTFLLAGAYAIAIAFEWKPGVIEALLPLQRASISVVSERFSLSFSRRFITSVLSKVDDFVTL